MNILNSREITTNGIIYVEESYDNGTTITQPKELPPLPPAPVRVISKYGMRQRFTFTERMAITASTDPGVKTIQDDLMSAETIDLDSPATAQSLGYIQAVGLIAATRIPEILA